MFDKKKKKKILFICKQLIDSYGSLCGVVTSTRHIAASLGKEGYETNVVVANDSNDIDRLVTAFDPDFVMIQALWVPPYKFEELLAMPRHKNRTWVTRVHSKTPFIANEGMAFDWIIKYNKIAGWCKHGKHHHRDQNLYIAPNSEEFNRNLNDLNINSIYLPNIYMLTDDNNDDKVYNDPHFIDIGCFGAIRPMKNQLIQAIAAIKFGDEKGVRVRFHINSTRHEQNGINVYKNIKAIFENCYPKHQLVEHEWLEHHDFLNLIKEMDICMQVSFSETFNLVTADAVSQGVPVVVSPEIEWLPPHAKVNPNICEEITEGLKDNFYGHKLVKIENRIALMRHNVKAKRRWIDFLTEEVEK